VKSRILRFAAPLVLPLAAVPFLLAAPGVSPSSPAGPTAPPEVVKWAFLSAAIVTGAAAVGAAIAVAVVGAAAVGAIAEKPETTGRALIFVGLAEGVAIYGLIIAIMILSRIP
jgi:V/A-type H+-transporting ATPase subunit K